MANVDDRDVAHGRVYAEAMFDLAEESGQGDSLLAELQDVVALADNDPRLGHFFGSPFVDEDVRARVIETLFRGKGSDLLVDSLQVINRNGRLAMLRAITEAYRLAHRASRGQVDVVVRTALPLTESQRARLVEVLTAVIKTQPVLSERVEPSLLGGIVVEVAGWKYDASVANRLQGLSEALHTRASEEILRGTAYVAE
ncbi:MAG TPA: ATP synthase F1 subunit delta [Thermoanaerobaculia bacterium]